MPVKVFFDESQYAECDTPEEAANFAKLMKNGTRPNPSKLQRPKVIADLKGAAKDQNIDYFFDEINPNAKLFLKTLVKHPSGIKGDDFAHEVQSKVEKFGGIFGGISKIAKKYGLSFEDFIDSEMKVEGTQRYRFLKPGPLLGPDVVF